MSGIPIRLLFFRAWVRLCGERNPFLLHFQRQPVLPATTHVANQGGAGLSGCALSWARPARPALSVCVRFLQHLPESRNRPPRRATLPTPVSLAPHRCVHRHCAADVPSMAYRGQHRVITKESRRTGGQAGSRLNRPTVPQLDTGGKKY